MKKPFAYITAVWKGGEFTVIDQAAVYCRKVYEAGFTPICPVLYLPHFLRDSIPAEHKDGIDIGRELLRRSHELAVMPSSRCIVQVQGVRPFYSKKYDLTKHPQYKYTADANPKFAFDVKAYLQHRLKVKPEEEFEVYDLGEIKQSQAAA